MTGSPAVGSQVLTCGKPRPVHITVIATCRVCNCGPLRRDCPGPSGLGSRTREEGGSEIAQLPWKFGFERPRWGHGQGSHHDRDIRAGRGPAPIGACSLAKCSANGISFCDDRACCPSECPSVHNPGTGRLQAALLGPAVGLLSHARWPLRQWRESKLRVRCASSCDATRPSGPRPVGLQVSRSLAG